MATVVLAWQLGAGAGHITRLLPFARELIARKHQVIGLFRDVGSAPKIYSGLPIKFLQAPHRIASHQRFPFTYNYVHMLANVGFGKDEELFGLASSWRNLFELIRPDLTIFDHSPIGLLASRGLPMKRITIGSGFFCPPDTSPLPAIMHPSANVTGYVDDTLAVEQELLNRCNALLAHWKVEPLKQLGNLYSQLDDVFLTTFPELDHFGARRGARYRGAITASGNQPPVWPTAPNAKKIFGYLKNSPAVSALFDYLADRKYSTLIVPDEIPPDIQKKYESPTLHFSRERLDMAQINSAADLIILNGNHGTLCTALLGGKASLQLPLFPEQWMVSMAVKRIGATEIMPSFATTTAAEIGQNVEKVLSTPSYQIAAAAFAGRYADFNQNRSLAAMCYRVCELLENGKK